MSAQFHLLQIKVQKDLQTLSKQITKIYQSKCNLSDALCETQSFNECAGTDHKVCINQFPRQNQCAFNGVQFSKSSGIRFPNSVDLSKLSNNENLFVCASARLDTLFLQIKKKYLDQIKRIYFGINNGFFRAFPGNMQNNTNGVCVSSYNPSQRIWYIEATTGSKNIIISIDMSVLSNQLQLKSVKSAVSKIISSLSVNNFLAIILVRNQTSVLIYGGLSRATEPIRTSLNNSIYTLTTRNYTQTVNYQLSFEKIRNIFSQDKTDAYGSKCEHATNIVIFITGTTPTEGNSTFQGLSEQIDSWNQNYKMKLIIYAVGNKTDDSLLKSLACKYEGSLFSVPQQDENSSYLVKNIKYYQKQLRKDINIDNPVCTQPYYDKNTGEKIITLSIPVYQYRGGERYILGAAGIDIQMRMLEEKYKISEMQVIKNLVKCNPSQPITMDKCYLEYLRPYNQKCGLQTCPAIQQQASCSFEVTSSVLAQPKQKQMQKVVCCGLTLSSFMLIIITVAVVIFILLIVAAYCMWRYCNKDKQKQSEVSDTKKLIKTIQMNQNEQNQQEQQNCQDQQNQQGKNQRNSGATITKIQNSVQYPHNIYSNSHNHYSQNRMIPSDSPTHKQKPKLKVQSQNKNIIKQRIDPKINKTPPYLNSQLRASDSHKSGTQMITENIQTNEYKLQNLGQTASRQDAPKIDSNQLQNSKCEQDHKNQKSGKDNKSNQKTIAQSQINIRIT